MDPIDQVPAAGRPSSAVVSSKTPTDEEIAAIAKEIAKFERDTRGLDLDAMYANVLAQVGLIRHLAGCRARMRTPADGDAEFTARVAETLSPSARRIAELERENARLSAALRDAWVMGFKLAVEYGDNYAHFDGEQKERQWAKARGFLDTALAPNPS